MQTTSLRSIKRSEHVSSCHSVISGTASAARCNAWHGGCMPPGRRAHSGSPPKGLQGQFLNRRAVGRRQHAQVAIARRDRPGRGVTRSAGNSTNSTRPGITSGRDGRGGRCANCMRAGRGKRRSSGQPGRILPMASRPMASRRAGRGDGFFRFAFRGSLRPHCTKRVRITRTLPKPGVEASNREKKKGKARR